MKKRVIIVHGWGGTPKEGWFPWLKRELETRDFDVFVPQLPDTDTPRIQKWVPALTVAVGDVDENTYFVGHSMGCQAIARYLEGLPEEQRVGGAIFVAGFFKRLTHLDETPDDEQVGQHWLNTPLDLEKVRSHLSKSVALFSDNDRWVPLDNQDDFKNCLGSEVIVEHEKGHFNEEAGFRELPVVRDKLLELAV